MSILYRGNRPLVSFNVENAEHRKWFAEFIKYNTWGKCPVRFMAESLDQDLVTHINGKMLHYYIKQEFGNGKNKTKNKTKPESTSTSNVVRKQHPVQAKGSTIKATVSTKTQAS
jgi:hypothetical protein